MGGMPRFLHVFCVLNCALERRRCAVYDVLTGFPECRYDGPSHARASSDDK